MARGYEHSKATLEQAAADRRFPTQHASNDQNQDEVMIVFPPGSDSRRALSFYRDAIAGKFGALAVEVVITPTSAVADGHLDMESEVTAEPPSAILIPGAGQ
jgi:DNA-binding transcriptional regulator PaaX